MPTDPERPGATGRFPEGKVHPDDEGELRFLIAHDPRKGVVVLDFGKPLKWLAMSASNARELGRQLMRHAAELEAGR